MKFKNQHVRVHTQRMRLHSSVLPFIEEALALAEAVPFAMDAVGFASITVNFDRIIGRCDRVSTSDHDSIVYAIRKGRNRHSRFVLGRNGDITNQLTMILTRKRKNEGWVLISAWFGDEARRDPQDPNQTPKQRRESVDFWSKNALIWGSVPVDETTITDIQPW